MRDRKIGCIILLSPMFLSKTRPAATQENLKFLRGLEALSSFGRFHQQLREANTARRRKARTARHLRRRQLRIEALEDRRVLAPVADFTAIPNPAAPNQAITFNGSSSYDTVPERTLVSYDWDFDNNGTTDLTGPTETVTHSYATAGS
jgi:hypothetical protein